MRYEGIEVLRALADDAIEDIIFDVPPEDRVQVTAELQGRGINVVVPDGGESPTVALARGEAALPNQRSVVVTARPEPAMTETQPTRCVPVYQTDDVEQITGGWLPPISPPKENELAGAVAPDGSCSLRTLVQWLGSTDDDPFCHQETVSSKWVNTFTNHVLAPQGAGWGYRTPIVHSALAGLDTNNSGFDDAAMRALSALESFTNARRGELLPNTRMMITTAVRRRYNPSALLLRAALLWYGLARNGATVFEKQRWVTSGSVTLPAQVDTPDSLNMVATALTREATDVLYTRLLDHHEFFMLDVLLALSSEVFPLQDAPGVAKLWPQMVNPRVTYSGLAQIGRTGAQISAQDVWNTMTRYCNIWDCHDLFAIAMNTVQCFALRPITSGWLAGSHKVHSYWPRSDLFVGVIGPFVAGITPEGMKTSPFAQPTFEAFSYGAAVKGCMLSAAYMSALQEMHEAHPIALAMGTGVVQRVNKLLHAQGAATFCKTEVAGFLKAAGWDFVDDGVASIGLGLPRDMLRSLLDTTRVPWWINVVRHLSSTGLQRIKDWLVPATPDKTPEPNEWCLFKHIGAVTEGQVAGALMWARAQLRYRVEMPNLNIRVVPVPLGDWSHFPPRVTPNFKYGRCTGEAALSFSVDAVKKLKLMTKLSRSKVELLPIHSTDQWYVTAETSRAGGPSDMDVALELRDAGLIEGEEFDYMLTPPAGPSPPTAQGLSGLQDVLQAAGRLHSHGFLSDLNMARLRTYTPGSQFRRHGDADAIISSMRGIRVYHDFRRIPIDKRLEVAQDALVLARNLAPYTSHMQHDGAREAIHVLIGAIQLFKEDPSITLAEAGRSPDELRAISSDPYYATDGLERGMEAGLSIGQTLAAAVERVEGIARGAAVDDPERQTEGVQDFGRGTSAAASTVGPSNIVRSAGVPSSTSGPIGFGPPPPSVE